MSDYLHLEFFLENDGISYNGFMAFLIGTTNPAKFARYRTILAEVGIRDVLSPREIGQLLPIVEDGQTAGENARRKAVAYAQATGLPTLGIDEALYIPALPAGDQPGTNVRRYVGRTASDEELLQAILAKISPIPAGQRQAVWIYALCLAWPPGRDIAAEVTIEEMFTDQPYRPLRPGYPLSSLLYVPAIGKTLTQLTPAEEAHHLAPLYTQLKQLYDKFVSDECRVPSAE